jgi:hypothetical protein
MIKYNKNIINTQIELKNLFQRQQDKLLAIIYPKRKVPTRVIINLKKELKKIKKQIFRKIKKNETKIRYASQKRLFEAKQRKRINKIVIALTEVPQYYLKKTEKQKKTNQKELKVKYARYWTSRKEYKIPYDEITTLRKHKRKKILLAHSLYETKIKNWTKLSEKRAKIFMSAYKNAIEQRSEIPSLFSTFRWEMRRAAQADWLRKDSKKTVLNQNQQEKYKNLKELKVQLFSKRSNEFLKPASKYRKAYSVLTQQQRWLKLKLIWLQLKRRRKPAFGVDFFKTMLGHTFLNAHRNTHIKYRRKLRFSTIKQKLFYGDIRAYALSSRDMARKWHNAQKRAWYYTNTVIPKRIPYYFQEQTAKTTFPFNKFGPAFDRENVQVWAKYAMAKRLVYSGSLTSNRREFKWLQKFSWIPFLRNKIAYRHKKNKVYTFRKRLMFDYDENEEIKSKFKARIKQILTTTTLPSYGNLRLKQFAKITKKAYNKKSTLLSSDENQLSNLELRLDVVVLRLNLAPNILWARRLIKDGSIFVSSNSSKEFEKMYAGFKQNTYPLKLRDPQNLYKKTQLTSYTRAPFNYLRNTKLKFLLEPLRNIDYITKPGDVILCAPGSLMHKYKTNPLLWQKPHPTHLLSFSHITESKLRFKPRSHNFTPYSRKEQPTTNVGVVLFNPKFSDISYDSRITRSFLRWMSL